jgi:hypothetical protein
MAHSSNNINSKDNCKKSNNDLYCENHDKEFRDKCTPVVGEVIGALGAIAANTPTRLPLTTVIFKTPGIKIVQDGGISVQEDGEYFISFNGTLTFLQPAPPPPTPFVPLVTFSVFTPDFSGTAVTGITPTSPVSSGVATLAELVCLRAGDTVYVTVSSSTTLTSATGILIIAKVED